ncbi:MAG: chitobiase/beta-hexosaminidase C-terminal domain-containing protein [Candidatus Acidiferrales bacterium]
MRKAVVKFCLMVLTTVVAPFSVYAQTSILTQHYDNARTGQNTNETILTPTNVNSTTFGKLFALGVDGYVYAQPLYVPGVVVPGQGTHNVLYVATEHDSLYAFDADTGGAPLWYVTFLVNGATTLSTSDVGNTQDIHPEIGITGTPVIDPATNTLYVVVNTKESGALIYRLHALDITTGAEKFGGPVMLSGSVPGTAPDGNGSSVPFNVQWANQRPGLLLQGGYLFIGFASHGDNGPWHGWILGYNATTLQQTGIWNTSPNGKGNGIWGAGSGLAADTEGNAYVSTGNGDDTVTIPAPPPSKTIDYGDSIVRISLANGNPTPTDYFTPYNQASLDSSDADLGSGGVLIPPDQGGPYPHILLEAGKTGEIYVVNRDQMTSDGSHYCNGCSSDPEIIQSVGGIGGLWSMPTYWNGNVYTWGNGDHLKAFTLSAGRLSTSPTSQSAESSGFPGSTAAVSSNGTTNGIVWAVESDAYTSNGPAILRAYNAGNVSTLLYGSNLTSGRDQLGPAVKFVVPVVTNGKVYVGAQMEVDVFGLLNSEPQTAAPVMNPPAGSYEGSVSVTMSSATPNSTMYYTTDGTAPSTSSNLYSGPVTLTVTTTINAIAISSGAIQSTDSAAAYVVASQTAPPNFTPAPGTYVSGQSITLTDDTAGAVIYYTTDGTTPSHSSTVYNGAIAVSSSTTIKAIGSYPGLSDSAVVSGAFTITSSGTTPINFGLGFSNPGCMQFNGSTDLDDSRLQLTNGLGNEAGSAFCTAQVDVRGFVTDFTFQLSDAQADGITFTLQNSAAAAAALGSAGGALGYGGPGGITPSVAIKFDLYNNNGEGDDSTGIYTDGAMPGTPSVDLTPSGIDLHSGDTMAVHVTYDGTTLTMTITDAVVNKTFTQSWPVNIPAIIGGNLAYAGFTGGTGGLTASQKIESWTFVSYVPQSQQWTIVTTSESAPNASALTDANGNPYPCSGQSPDNSGDANPNCYNPLVITTDWHAPTIPGGGTNTTMLANTFTNSGCSAAGNVTSITTTGYLPSGTYNAVISMVLDSGATITFTGTSSSNNSQFSGTFSSTGSCMGGDSGTFVATLFPTVTGMYAGSFESTTGGSNASVQMGLQTDWNFNVTGTIAPATGAPVCFSNLTIGTPLASTYGSSMASGDVIEAFGSDSSGNVVAFIASNTDANEKPLPDGGLYVTYVGLAGACNGISGTDVPFKKVVTWRWQPPRPIWPRAPFVPGHAPIWRFMNVQAQPWLHRLERPAIRPEIHPELRADPRPKLRPEITPEVHP